MEFEFSKRAVKATIFYNGKGFIKVILDDGAEMELDDILEQRKIAHEFAQGKPHVVLAIAGSHTSATKEARVYSSKNIPEGRLAKGVIVKSLAVRLMGTVYISFHKPGVPTKLFENETEAIHWLNEKLNLQ